MIEYSEEDFLLLSGIQHFAFCKRQWALIHIEQQWNENIRTIEGKILHEKAHDSILKEKRTALIISRGMHIFSRTLGFAGACDVVEFKEYINGVCIFGREGRYLPTPIEYKRGKPKEDEVDIVQLCAQAMCLEEMLLCEIPEGFLYYNEIKHRQKVVFDEEVRRSVIKTANEMHEYFNKQYTPKVKVTQKCRSCSLNNICMPKLCKNPSAARYIKNNLSEMQDEKIT
jgi:CRISPR-associated exonuclease Cas4